jgi:hypothetical protein
MYVKYKVCTKEDVNADISTVRRRAVVGGDVNCSNSQ